MGFRCKSHLFAAAAAFLFAVAAVSGTTVNRVIVKPGRGLPITHGEIYAIIDVVRGSEFDDKAALAKVMDAGIRTLAGTDALTGYELTFALVDLGGDRVDVIVRIRNADALRPPAEPSTVQQVAPRSAYDPEPSVAEEDAWGSDISDQGSLPEPLPDLGAVLKGHAIVQVQCSEGTEIFIDGVSAGKADPDLGGVVLGAVTPGEHLIVASAPDMPEQRVVIDIKANTMVLVRVTEADIRPEVIQGGEPVETEAAEELGELWIWSVPVECEVTIKGAKIEAKVKDSVYFYVGELHPGRYDVECSANDRVLTQAVQIVGGREVRLFFDFPNGTVADVDEAETRLLWEREHLGKPLTVAGLKMAFTWVPESKGWVAAKEVCNADYRLYDPDHGSGTHNGKDLDGARQPATRIPYSDAEAFAVWLTETENKAGRLPQGWAYRLPSASEWLAAARAGDERLYPWGDVWPPAAGNYGIKGHDDRSAVSCDVDDAGENGRGFIGLAGNAAEWTDDWYSDAEQFRVVRGGSWVSRKASELACYWRGHLLRPDDRSFAVGFRLTLMPVTEEEEEGVSPTF